MSESPTLTACSHAAKSAAKLAAAWAEAVDLFGHNAAVALHCAREAREAAREALAAARDAASLAASLAAERAKSEQAQQALADAERARQYAEQAARSATHAHASAQAARRFTPAPGDLAALCRLSQQAIFAWVACPAGDPVKLAVLRAQMEEAQAAVQAALPLPATA